MDFDELDVIEKSNAGIPVKLLSPRDGTELGVTITVLGQDSDVFHQTLAKQRQRRMANLRPGAGAANMLMTKEESEAAGIELLAACTVAWDDNGNPELRIKDVTYPCNPTNAAMFYKMHPWMREQVDAEVSNRKNFTKG